MYTHTRTSKKAAPKHTMEAPPESHGPIKRDGTTDQSWYKTTGIQECSRHTEG